MILNPPPLDVQTFNESSNEVFLRKSGGERRLSFEKEEIVKSFQAALTLVLLVFFFFFIRFFIWRASHRIWQQNRSNEQIVCIYLSIGGEGGNR